MSKKSETFQSLVRLVTCGSLQGPAAAPAGGPAAGGAGAAPATAPGGLDS